MNLSKSEFRHIMQMLEDAADVLESYPDHESQAHEIRASIKIIIKNNEEEMTFSDELYLESRGEK